MHCSSSRSTPSITTRSTSNTAPSPSLRQSSSPSAPRIPATSSNDFPNLAERAVSVIFVVIFSTYYDKHPALMTMTHEADGAVCISSAHSLLFHTPFASFLLLCTTVLAGLHNDRYGRALVPTLLWNNCSLPCAVRWCDWAWLMMCIQHTLSSIRGHNESTILPVRPEESVYPSVFQKTRISCLLH